MWLLLLLLLFCRRKIRHSVLNHSPFVIRNSEEPTHKTRFIHELGSRVNRHNGSTNDNRWQHFVVFFGAMVAMIQHKRESFFSILCDTYKIINENKVELKNLIGKAAVFRFRSTGTRI